jgi:hypothetical protein
MDQEDGEKMLKIFSAVRNPGDALLLLRQLLHFILLAFNGPLIPRGVLHTYPNEPMPFYTIWGTARRAGLTVKRGIGPIGGARRGKQLTMLFADQTRIDPGELPPEHVAWLNGRCLDISKSTVARISDEIFGTGLAIDPRTHRGKAVKKSELNGMHDAEIVRCPAEPEEGYAYQRLVGNETPDGNEVEDLRAVIVGAQIPLVYRKRRKAEDRFRNVNSAISIEKPAEVFSENELKGLLAFAERIGLDFGELDVLRDAATKELFVVDANRTSTSPPIALPFGMRLTCFTLMGKAFKKEFLRR